LADFKLCHATALEIVEAQPRQIMSRDARFCVSSAVRLYGPDRFFLRFYCRAPLRSCQVFPAALAAVCEIRFLMLVHVKDG